MQNNSINRYGNANATRCILGEKSHGHQHVKREKTKTKLSLVQRYFDFYIHIDNKERARASD